MREAGPLGPASRPLQDFTIRMRTTHTTRCLPSTTSESSTAKRRERKAVKETEVVRASGPTPHRIHDAQEMSQRSHASGESNLAVAPSEAFLDSVSRTLFVPLRR